MPGRIILRGAAVLTFALLAACDQPTDPLQSPPRRLVIHAVLDAGATHQDVIVEYIDSNFGHSPVFVSDAVVSVTLPDGRVLNGRQEEDATGLVYRIPDFGHGMTIDIVPGGTYTLTVFTTLGEVVSGTTTVPSFTQRPSGGEIVTQPFERERDTLRLSWDKMPGARRYEVMINSYYKVQGGGSYRRNWSTFTDTSIVLPGTARTLDNDPVFVPGGPTDIAITAVDDNYYTYYHPTSDPFAGAPPSRLKGALGVFGSVVPVRFIRYQEVQ